jgi:TolA-binding protein
METTLLLNAISDLKQFTTGEIDRLYKSQEERFERLESQLVQLNGKVAEHERRFLKQDGAEDLRRKQQERAAMLHIHSPSSANDSDDALPADVLKRVAFPSKRTTGESIASSQRGTITANLSVRDLLWLLVAIAAVVSGRWEAIMQVLSGGTAK